MKTLKWFGIGLAATAMACLVSTSARASLVIVYNGPPTLTDSWSVGWTVSGGTFDKISGTIFAGNLFEIPGLTATGWTSTPSSPPLGSTASASISDGSVSSLNFTTTFQGTPTTLPPELILFQVYAANVFVGEQAFVWNQDALGGLGEFDYTVVPEAGTMLAGVLLLLPFAASTIRILRKNRLA